MSETTGAGGGAPGDDARAAGASAVDPDRLLPGEDPDARDVDDAHHWVQVYGELLGLKREVLQTTLERMGAMADAGRTEAELDVTVMRAEEARLTRRLEQWRLRLRELTGTGDNG